MTPSNPRSQPPPPVKRQKRSPSPSPSPSISPSPSPQFDTSIIQPITFIASSRAPSEANKTGYALCHHIFRYFLNWNLFL